MWAFTSGQNAPLEDVLMFFLFLLFWFFLAEWVWLCQDPDSNQMVPKKSLFVLFLLLFQTIATEADYIYYYINSKSN